MPLPRLRPPRLRVRAAAGLLAVLAIMLAAIRPYVVDSYLERYLRAMYYRGDVFRHVADGPRVAGRFARLVQEGQSLQAYGETTPGFRRRTTLQGFKDLFAARPFSHGPYELTQGVVSFDSGWPIGEYRFLVGPTAGERSDLRIILIVDGGVLKVDRITGTIPK